MGLRAVSVDLLILVFCVNDDIVDGVSWLLLSLCLASSRLIYVVLLSFFFLQS